ncbi:MAG: hypothetical protein FJW32_14250 [Acidobacteria bacterium]|nr:hypothetical protein [Acidobacteriota bacterium]
MSFRAIRGGMLLASALMFADETFGEPAPSKICVNDARCNAVRNFFLSHKSPLAPKAELFVSVADRHGLDWRLLPSLSMVESSGGKAGKRNNVFGWNSGKAAFKTVDAGIEFVGRRLGTSKLYAGSTMDKLRRYNPARTLYPPKVVKFMRLISDDPVE